MRTSIIAAAVLSTTALATRPASADLPKRDLYFGAALGANIVTDDWDLYRTGDGGIAPNTGFAGALRVGTDVLWFLSLEAGVTFLPYKADTKNTNLALSYTADALIHPLKGDWVPFIDLGGGVYHNVNGDMGRDADYHLHYGLGLRGKMNDDFTLRVEARHMLTDGYESKVGNNIELLAGIDWSMWHGESKSEPVDSDGDAVVDGADACPKVKGSPSASGCPDADGDGIADANDLCPNEAGVGIEGGCPKAAPPPPPPPGDKDGDNVIDESDKCPEVAGVEALDGCPDADGDGITDADDKCPESKGGEDVGGCPDGDGDKVIDTADKCVTEPGPAATEGCPDADGDGIPDAADKCPNEAGVREAEGCLPKAVAKTFAGTLKGIQFLSSKAAIRAKSASTLAKVIEVLKKYPSLRVRMEGHTDSAGNADNNQKLSQARADSVRQYLVDRGIDSGRLEAAGFGETKPIATNKTKAGRAQNRRIEFKIIGN